MAIHKVNGEEVTEATLKRTITLGSGTARFGVEQVILGSVAPITGKMFFHRHRRTGTIITNSQLAVRCYYSNRWLKRPVQAAITPNGRMLPHSSPLGQKSPNKY